MTKGKVKWFNDQKGFGFITAEDGREIFVHHTGINAQGFKTLPEGGQVEFEIENGDKGPRAVKVTLIK